MTLESILPIPDIFSARRILCIQPHYDDNDIGAGGTLARLAQNGATLFYITVTDDLMGVVDASLPPEAATQALRRDQMAAAAIIGVEEQFWLGFPDAGEYNRFDVRRNLLALIRRLKPDFLLTCDPWLTYEAHPDHVRTGLAAAEAALFCDLTRIASADPAADSAYEGHSLSGVAFYYTREPNQVVDVSDVWETKFSAVKCYQTQFTLEGMNELLMALDLKSRQIAQGSGFEHGEALKVLHPSALHCGL